MSVPVRLELDHRFPVSLREGFEYITDLTNWPEYWPRLVRIGTPYVQGRALLVTGQLAVRDGAYDDARRACEDALERFVEVAAPYDAALARLELARALAALARAKRAATQARAARDAFAALGAAREVARAEAPLANGPRDRAPGDVSPRELAVLRLVAHGLGDAEIAERLTLSPHTVHRHVANVCVKLRLPFRAAAVAHAARAGLL
jgi:ATP/maltotriose-dependent transcriptional regulator MalT